MIRLIKELLFAWRYKRAVKEANALAWATGLKYYVLVIGGKLKVVPKRNVKNLIRTRKFRKGTRIEDIEKRALHVTGRGLPCS